MACPGVPEDLDQFFCGCKNVRALWPHFLSNDQFFGAQNLPFTDWLLRNLDLRSGADPLTPWKEVFASIIWWIWNWRNSLIFKNTAFPLPEKLFTIRRSVEEVSTAMTNAQFMHGGIGKYITKWVGWQTLGQG